MFREPGSRSSQASVCDIIGPDEDLSEADSEAELHLRDLKEHEQRLLRELRSIDGPVLNESQAKPQRVPPRVPRRSAEPRADIKARLFQANQSFLNGDYNSVQEQASNIIRLNAEVPQAWSLLAAVYREHQDFKRAIVCMINAAHLQPKVSDCWLQCADLALETGDSWTARYCYSTALKADRNCVRALISRADLLLKEGKLPAAIADFGRILELKPRNLETTRKLAEACVDCQKDEEAVRRAIAAYRSCFWPNDQTTRLVTSPITWADISAYAQLLARIGDYKTAISDIKSLARHLVGRQDQRFWDDWLCDDREWDYTHERRHEVPHFSKTDSKTDLFGQALPLEVRALLALYRLRLGDEVEGMRHLASLDPEDPAVATQLTKLIYLARELGDALSDTGHISQALAYYEVIIRSHNVNDPLIYVQAGRCYLKNHDHCRAEELFLSAIKADNTNIEARVELAKLYESAKEEEEALILASEALALQDARDAGLIVTSTSGQLTDRRERRAALRVGRAHDDASRSPDESISQREKIVKSRYRPRRLVDSRVRRQQELARAAQLSKKYSSLRILKDRILAGEAELVGSWMAVAKELVDDFRSSRQFYSWDRFLRYLGYSNVSRSRDAGRPNSQVSDLVQRLRQHIAPMPEEEYEKAETFSPEGYQGISFREWLDLFLDYATGLARHGEIDTAYEVCEAARDSLAFQSSSTSSFLIHITWGACAVLAGDEETCVAMARVFMRDETTSSDSSRMFASLCRLSERPAFWYSSGPSQKHILRQIKAMDLRSAARTQTPDESSGRDDQLTHQSLDVCLLMLYGHILFTSSSYAHSLNYFLRARALDIGNPLINLSAGLGYIHHALKRQSNNRQFHIAQGLALLFQYHQTKHETSTLLGREASYNIARAYHAFGLYHLALRYYQEAQDQNCSSDVSISASYNIYILHIISKELTLASSVLEVNIIF